MESFGWPCIVIVTPRSNVREIFLLPVVSAEDRWMGPEYLLSVVIMRFEPGINLREAVPVVHYMACANT